MLATTTKSAATMTNPMITGRLSVPIAWTDDLAEAAEAEDRLHHDDAAEQLADVHAQLRDDRREGGADAVPEDHPPLGQPLGPGRADVVLAERLEQLAAGQPGVDGRLDGREGDPGQDHVPGPRDEALGEMPA